MFKNCTRRFHTVGSLLGIALAILLYAAFSVVIGFSQNASAAPSKYLNFQARLRTSSGSVVPDGNYNIEFKLYDQASGGTALWTETRVNTDRVRVVNGYFSVSLGSVEEFPDTIAWGEEHWLTMNIGGTGSPSWDGEMNPRLQLTAVPYAFRADIANSLTDGTTTYTVNDFLKVSPGSSQSANSSNAAIRLNQTGSGGLLQLQSNGVDMLTLSNTGDLSVSGSATIGGDLVVDSSSTSGTIFTVNTSSGFSGDLADFKIDGDSILRISDDGTIYWNGAGDCNSGCINSSFVGLSGDSVLQAASGSLTLVATQVNVGYSDTTGTLLVLDTKTDTGDPTGVNGGMYYNSDTKKFRCYENDAWKDCITTANIGDLTNGGNTTGSAVTIGTNDNYGLNLEVNNVTVASFSATGEATFKNVSDSSTAFQIQNAVGQSLFSADTTNAGTITLGNISSGETGEWGTTSSTLGVGTHTAAVVHANGYLYIIGGQQGSTITNDVQYARINADGSTGAWASLNDLPVALSSPAAVVANGHVYVYGGWMGGGDSSNQGFRARIHPDGTLGEWVVEEQEVPVAASGPGLVATKGHLYFIGGGLAGYDVSDAVYSAPLKADGSVGAWTVATSLPEGRAWVQAVVANGRIYIVGGFGDSLSYNPKATVYYAPLNEDGSVGSWMSSPSTLPAARATGVTAVSNGYLYSIGGSTNIEGDGVRDDVYYARINPDGSLGAWDTSSHTLPASRGFMSGSVVNGVVYTVGGYNGSASEPTVFYTRLGSTVQVAGNLDLVSLQGGSLADAGQGWTGSMGGSITAGNGTFVGSLQVQGSALFNQDLSVNGLMNVTQGLSLGTPDDTASLLVLDTKTSSGDPEGVQGAMYYNSNSNKFRCYEGPTGLGVWKDCITAGSSLSSARTVALIPEFENVVMRGDGSDNIGYLTADFCSGSSRMNINAAACGSMQTFNYYSWTTTEASAQDYDLFVRWRVPDDFDSSVRLTSVTANGWRTDATNNAIEIGIYNANGVQCGTTTQVAGNGSWASTAIANMAGDSDCDIAAGDYIMFRVRMNADTGDIVRLGHIEIAYTAVL